MELTFERLRELLHYEPETGVFTHARDVRVGKAPGWVKISAGQAAGCIKNSGKKQYRVIGIDGRLHRAARLAWFYCTGSWPAGDVDHVDGDSTNDRIANLRDVSRTVNMQNIKRAFSSNKSSGLLGATASFGKWQAQIKVNGRLCRLGRFDTPEEAHAAYIAAKRKLHEGCTI